MKKNPILMAALMVALMTLGATSATGSESRDLDRELRSAKSQAERGGGEGGTLSTSAATSGCWEDPSYDTVNMSTGGAESYPKADIIKWCATYENGEVRLRQSNAEPSSPTSDPNWINGLTGLLWGVDLNGDGQTEYDVFYGNSGSGLRVDVERSSDNTTACAGTGSYDGTYFVAAFPASCIGNPPAIYVDAFGLYDSNYADPNAPVYGDISDFYGGPVEPAASAAPAPSDPNPPQPAPSGDHFTDDDGNPHEANINFVYEQGLIKGCGPSLFCPNEPLTRAQFATIMANYIRSQQ